MSQPDHHKYCSRYCEENVWHLAQDPAFAERERVVAIISSYTSACLFWEQRACDPLDAPVWWDYHVILLVRSDIWRVYDLDTALDFPTDAERYLRNTFRWQQVVPEDFRPRFMLFGGDEYVAKFASDRSHMRDAEGQWYSPPPDWPAVDRGRGEGFLDFIDRHWAAGAQRSLDQMLAEFTEGRTPRLI